MFLTDIFPKVQNQNQKQFQGFYQGNQGNQEKILNNPIRKTEYYSHINNPFDFQNIDSTNIPHKKLEDNTDKLESILELKLKEYLSQNENLYDKTRLDLINLINEMKSSQNNNKTNDSQLILDEISQLKSFVRSNLAYNPQIDLQNRTLTNMISKNKKQSSGTDITIENENIKKESKGSYYKVIPSVWENVKQEFTCLEDKWKDLCYSRGDGVYIKIKKKYEKLDKNNISKIIFKLQN